MRAPGAVGDADAPLGARRNLRRWYGVCVGIALTCAHVLTATDARLADAVKRRDAATVQTLLAAKADVNAAQPDGATALHWAAYWDDGALAERVIRAGARVNTANDLGVTPLSLACANGSAAMVTRLLKAGASPSTPPPAVPPIMTCARTGNLDAVKALVAAGADVNATEAARQQTALMWATAQDHADVVRFLLRSGASPHARSTMTFRLINRANPNDPNQAVVGEVPTGGSTPLLFAARQGSVASAAALLDAGAKVDDVAPDGATPLVVAAHSNQGVLATLLLDRGANPNVIGAGYTALHAAVLRGNAALVSALAAHGANVNARVRNGTPTTRGTHDYFLQEGLAGATPFWLAARFLEVEAMRVLASAGADRRAALPNGTTPLMAAAGLPAQPPLFDRRDRLRLLRTADEPEALAAVRLALDLGADINAANVEGDTALHGAAAQNYPSVARLLVERGARLEAKNARGATPLAVANGPEVAASLRALGAAR